MKFYIATGFENWKRHNEVRDMICSLGHEITFDWTLHKYIDSFIAMSNEIRGVEEADFLVVILPGLQGTHVELGIAIACDKPILILVEDNDYWARYSSCPFYYFSKIQLHFGILNKETLNLFIHSCIEDRGEEKIIAPIKVEPNTYHTFTLDELKALKRFLYKQYINYEDEEANKAITKVCRIVYEAEKS